jgi:DNA repair exonuclease SbcCD ATPase subunit
MLHQTLIQRIEGSLQSLDNATNLVEVLDSFEELNELVDQQIAGIAEGGNITGYGNSLNAQFASLSSVIKQLNPRKLFKDIEVFQQHLLIAIGTDTDETKQVIKVLDELDAFAEAYNVYVTNQIGANAFALLLVSRRLRQSLANLREFLEYITKNYSRTLTPAENEAEFSLFLLYVPHLPHFAEKLKALQALYEELCYLLDISVASCPLRIGKIESGSLWTRLFGDSKAVSLMISLVEGAAKFMHRNYTIEGKIASIPKKIESLNSILDFSNRLKANGVDVNSLEDKLAKSALSITDSLNILVSDQPLIEINGQVLSVGSEVQKALIEQASALKLQYKPSTDLPIKVSPSRDTPQ